MRATTLELLRRYYDAFNRGDMETFLSLITEDCVHDLNQGGRQVGRQAFAAFMAKMNRCYREQLVDLVLFSTDDGQRAAAEFVVVGKYLATDDGLPAAHGQTYRLPAGTFFEIRDQEIARVTTYYDLKQWIAQVGG